jgi:hypothetical protein
MKWPIDVMNVGQVNDEGVPLDMVVNTANGVANPVGIRWLDQKWTRWTLQKLYSSIHSISGRAKVEGEEGSYEDHLSCLEEVQE